MKLQYETCNEVGVILLSQNYQPEFNWNSSIEIHHYVTSVRVALHIPSCSELFASLTKGVIGVHSVALGQYWSDQQENSIILCFFAANMAGGGNGFVMVTRSRIVVMSQFYGAGEW